MGVEERSIENDRMEHHANEVVRLSCSDLFSASAAATRFQVPQRRLYTHLTSDAAPPSTIGHTQNGFHILVNIASGQGGRQAFPAVS
jgi:hypothetical protein